MKLLNIAAVAALVLAGTMPWTATQAADDDCLQVRDDVDILFAMDLTSSMRQELDAVQDDAADLLAVLEAGIPNPRFAVAGYQDHPTRYNNEFPSDYTYAGGEGHGGPADDYRREFGKILGQGGFVRDDAWHLHQGFTASTAATEAAIQGLALSDGADWPEALSLALHEGTNLPWRSGEEVDRIMVIWGDAPPHDGNFANINLGIEPGPDGRDAPGTHADFTPYRADDLRFRDVVRAAADAGIRVMMVNAGPDENAAANMGPAYTAYVDGDYSVDLWFDYIADETDGTSIPLVDSADGLAEAILGFVGNFTPKPMGQAAALSLATMSGGPEEAWFSTGGHNATVAGDGEGGAVQQSSLLAAYELSSPGDQASATVLEESAIVDKTLCRTATAATTTLTAVSALGGVITADVLHNEAYAEFNATTDQFWVDGRHHIVNLTIAGTPIAVDDASICGVSGALSYPCPIDIDLPGGGFVRLFERTTFRNDTGEYLMDTLLHVYGVDDAYGRFEVLLGNVFVQVGDGWDARQWIHPAIDTQDDAGSGRDAGADDASAVTIDVPGAYEGRTSAIDNTDRYAFAGSDGDTLRIVFDAAGHHRVNDGHIGLDGVTPDMSDAPEYQPTDSPTTYELALYRPGGLRAWHNATSFLVAEDALVAEVPLDFDGTWHLEIHNPAAGTNADEYSFALALGAGTSEPAWLP